MAAEAAADSADAWVDIVSGSAYKPPASLDSTPPASSSSQPIPPALSKAASMHRKIHFLIVAYDTVEFAPEEKDADYSPTTWWTNTSRHRPYYTDIASLVDPTCPLRQLALTILSTPSSSSNAERVRHSFN